MTTTDVLQQVQLIDGEFTASEASDVLNALLREKINFHKLNRLSLWEGDLDCDTSFDDSRLAKLQSAQKEVQELCKEVRLAGRKMRINGVLEIQIID
jgi:ubiquinone biosynthesis protein UbiJ